VNPFSPRGLEKTLDFGFQVLRYNPFFMVCLSTAAVVDYWTETWERYLSFYRR